MGVTDAQRKEYLRKFRVEIIETLKLDVGLLDEMHTEGVLNQRQVTAISINIDVNVKNTKLLEDVLLKCDLDKYNIFLDLLEKEQKDLANKLRGKQDANAPRTPAAATAAKHEGMSITLSDTAMKVPRTVNREKYEELQQKAETDENFMYKMDRKPRGMALIINVQDSRLGTDVDRDNLQNLWEDFMHFNVTTYNDKDGLTAQGIMSKVKDFSDDTSLKESQAIVVCLLAHGTNRPIQKILVTEKDEKQEQQKDHKQQKDQKQEQQEIHEKHGQEGYIQGTDGILVPLKEIYSFFSNENDKIKQRVPRLFFIQTCRGEAIDKGVDIPDACSAEDEDEDEDDAGITVTDAITKQPTLTDCFWGFATPQNSYAFRNPKGSWYITALVTRLYDHADEMDLAAIHNLVNHTVTKRKANCPNNEKDGAKTIPEYKSSLTKAHLYFFP